MSFRITSLVMAALASVFFQGTSSAALQTYFTLASYNAALAGLGANVVSRPVINFDSNSPGAIGTSFSTGGVTFGNTVGLSVSSGTTSSGPNFLGIDAGFGEFSGGDVVTLGFSGPTAPFGVRGVSMNIITDSIPDFTNFGTLSVGGVDATTDPALGTALTDSSARTS